MDAPPPGAVPWTLRLIQLVAFVLLGCSGHLLLRSLYLSTVPPAHKVTLSDRAFLEAPQRLDVVVVGDSMPRNAVDPQILGPRAVNIASGGEHLLKTWYRLRWLVDHGDKDVGAVLMPIGPASFTSWHASDFAPEPVWGKYVDFLEVGRVRGETWPWWGAMLKSRYFPYVGELRTFNQLRTGRFAFQLDRLAGRFDRMPPARRKAAGADAARIHFAGHDHADPALRWAFDQLLAWLDARGITTVLVSYPVTREYSSQMSTYGAGQTVRTLVVDPVLEAGHPPLLDYHNRYFDHPSLFADAHHLNPTGRTAFSSILRGDLEEMGILEE